MKKTFFATLLLLVGMMTAPVMAQTFSFDAEGEGEVNWDFEFMETEELTVSNGAEFAFNGGAGADGDARANGGFAVVGGAFGEYALGGGNAYSNTNGRNFAEASFESGSFAASGGLAADLAFGSAARLNFGGVVTAGGAGSVDTGLTTGTTFSYGQSGSGSFDLDADLTATLN